MIGLATTERMLELLRTRRREFLAASVAITAYLWLGLSWFDHDIDTALSRVPSAIPALAFALALAWWFVHRRRRPLFEERADRRWLVALSGTALVSRLPFLFGAYGLYSSDAAVQGVMALHILEGKHHPVFLYGWSYIGSGKAHLTALVDVAVDEPVLSFTLAAILVYAAFTGALFVLARTVLDRPAAIAACAYVIAAPGFLTAWGIHNEGSYLDVLSLGTWMLAIGARWLLAEDRRERLAPAFWMGLLGGVAFWTHILATYYLLTAVGLLVVADLSARLFRRMGAFAAGFLLGDFPGILWNVTHEWLSFRWWSVGAGPSQEGDRLERAGTQLTEVLRSSLAVLGGWWPHDQRPWPEAFWRWALLATVLLSFLAFVVGKRAQIVASFRPRRSPEALAVAFSILVVLVFVNSSFGWMTEEPRYLLFLYSALPLFVAFAWSRLWQRSRALGMLAAAALLYVNLHGSIVYLSRAVESDATNREFLEQVVQLPVRYAHTDYHLSYKYIFLSHGYLVWTSELGPEQKQWYEPFREIVAEQQTIALVPRSNRFARRLGLRMDERGIRYRRANLLYPILYDFSERPRLSDLRRRRPPSSRP